MKHLPLLILCVFIFSCSGDYSPKPSAYFRIEMEEPVYQEYKDSLSLFSFNIQQNAVVESMFRKERMENGLMWFIRLWMRGYTVAACL